MTIKVVFRKFPEDAKLPGGGIIALTCGTAKDCSYGHVMSYMHVGQHAEASRYLGLSLPLATPEEYEPLRRELERVYDAPVVAVRRLRA